MATISQALAIAIQHHQAGRLQAAEQIYRQILAVEPNQAEAIHLLGVIAHQLGKHENALEYIARAIALEGSTALYHVNLAVAYVTLRRLPEAIASYGRALELDPDNAEGHNSLGSVLKEQGNLDVAVASYCRALELKPDFAEAHYNLGVALECLGKLEPSVASYRRALELRPTYPEACCNLGNVLKQQGKLDEALASYRRAVELKPSYAEAHNNLGAVLNDRGKLDEAVASYRRALELMPDFAAAHSNLGVVLDSLGKTDEAVASYRRALELEPDNAGTHNNLGNAWWSKGKPDEAIACYRRALELKPSYAEAHGNLGSLLEQMGDLYAAEDAFRTAIRHDSRFAFAHYKLARLLGGKLPQDDLAAQQRLLEEGALTDSQRLFLHFGLAQVLDRRGAYAEAAEHLDRGNALQLARWRQCGQVYDPKEYESTVTRMIGVSTPAFFDRVRGFGLESETPVFVVGLPRSGTTLIEQILASHSQVFGAGEITLVEQTMAALAGPDADIFRGLRRLDRQAAGRLASQHLERLRALNREAIRVVDKMPDNYLYLGPLACLFPRAKFIHCRRDLRDVGVSCWMTYFQKLPWANDPQHIASRFRQYQRIMEHWRMVLPTPLLEVDYEETVADLERVARKLVAWCGLAWEPACLEFQRAKRAVRTASAVQVRQPVFSTSVGRWQHYQRALAPLLAGLEHG